MWSQRTLYLVAICLWTACASIAGPAPVDYTREIKPLLANRCVHCHGPVRAEGGLRLDTAALLAKGGDSGPGLSPSKPEQSLILHAAAGTDGATKMPAEGDPLTSEQTALLRRWIAEGAKAPAETTPPDAKTHWAFQLPRKSPVPTSPNPAWNRNPIDAFLAAQHQSRGIIPRPRADKFTLLRRATLDVTGVPPTRAEIDAYLADGSPDAFEKVVDRLLASPHYGERWGRHWMDVWRYSDWYGYGGEVRNSQPFIWRWRDWIVESLNKDLPYNQMIVDMLAADEAAPCDQDKLRATGFLVRNWYRYNRNFWLNDAVEHTAKAFLGLTINCARCHDHMYDPISQVDYYRFRAIFEPHNVRTDLIAGAATTAKDGLPRVFDKDAAAPTFLFVRGNDDQPVKDKPLTPGTPEFLGRPFNAQSVSLPPRAYKPDLDLDFRKTLLDPIESRIQTTRLALDQAQASIKAAHEFKRDATKSAWIDDDFSRPRPDRWKLDDGWKYDQGRLRCLQPHNSDIAVVSLSDHPRDFTAGLALRIVGGKTHRSVGLAFDRSGATEQIGVYLSANDQEQKIQITETTAGAISYPITGKAEYPVHRNETYLLRVDVRDDLLLVSVDGRPVVAHRLKKPRRSGRFAVWAFDASADLLGATVRPLTHSDAIAFRIEMNSPPFVRSDLESKTILAKYNPAMMGVLASRIAQEESLRSRTALAMAADDARYAEPPRPQSTALIVEAARAERIWKRQSADLALVEAILTRDELKASLQPTASPAAKKAEEKVASAERELAAVIANEKKPPKDYTPLAASYPATSTGRRLALARWITDKDNPLTARVAVNHLWMRHFGAPLVGSVFDFGRNGKAPTHPALLDWLACEFVEKGYSMKAMHRLMLTSAAYQMDSTAAGSDDPNRKIDPDNHFLWRMNPRRLESESVRDSLLAAAGSLEETLGGPDLEPAKGETVHRRSLYFRHAPEKQAQFLMLFDSASVIECYQRSETVVPQQALALANSGLSLTQARVLARSLERRAKDRGGVWSNQSFIDEAFLTILGRPAGPTEANHCEQFLADQSQRLTGAVPKGKPTDVATPAADPNSRARESLVHVLINHSDFVTIR